jgi:hypothetical protein
MNEIKITLKIKGDKNATVKGKLSLTENTDIGLAPDISRIAAYSRDPVMTKTWV